MFFYYAFYDLTTMSHESAHDLAPLRHSLAHLLGAAMERLYPTAHRTIGPAVDNGFYYDFDLAAAGVSVSEHDLPTIEAAMRELLPTWTAFERVEVTPEEAYARVGTNPYKRELIDELVSKGEPITFYRSGTFEDLCRGGHVDDLTTIDPHSFALTKVAGAYWRGDETKPMLTRIYGLAFATAADLAAHQTMMVEAAKRDHKVLGRQLRLFTFSPTVGSGLPIYLPRGMRIRTAILDYLTMLKEERGYQFVWTPHLAKEALYQQSGHLGKYDAMLPSIETDGGERFVLKPMNCPHHFQVYNDEPHSYRDLPYRIAENATDYRNEKSGELNGLFRVRSLTQDDTHHVVRHDQVPAEIDMVLELTRTVYETFGFKNFRARISVRDPKDHTKYFGTDELWSTAEAALIDGVKRWGVPYFVGEGEAAFYGPKIDILVDDAIGRSWQLTTVQLDYVQPENFDMTYTDASGNRTRPAVLHVAILGSLDRFFGMVIEHFGGAFPVWLAPVQVRVLPVNETVAGYALDICDELRARGIRAEVSPLDETLGRRIRTAELEKLPYTLVVGEKEAAAGTVSIRHYHLGQDGTVPRADFVTRIVDEAARRA